MRVRIRIVLALLLCALLPGATVTDLTCNPLTQWCIFEDFAIGGAVSTTVIGLHHWAIDGSSCVTAESGEDFGVVSLISTTSDNSQCTIYANVRITDYSTKVFDTYVRFKLSDTTSIGFFAGMTGANNDGESNNDYIGVAYDTDASDTNFMCVTRSGGGTATRTSIGVAADTSYHYARIRATAAGTILCSLDGGSETTVSATVPTARIGPMLTTFTRTTAVRTGYFDYFYQLITR